MSEPAPAPPITRAPLYIRLLRLRQLRPNGWQRALLGEGSFVLAAILVLSDVATAWTLLVLPLAVAAVVKLDDLFLGLLRRPAGPGNAAAAPPHEEGRR